MYLGVTSSVDQRTGISMVKKTRQNDKQLFIIHYIIKLRIERHEPHQQLGVNTN
jgi:hypothetical protein